MKGPLNSTTLGVPDGQEVEVQVRVIPAPQQWGDGLRRCAGALANEWTDEDDRVLEQIHEDRKRETRRIQAPARRT
jgi:hypothetical protein